MTQRPSNINIVSSRHIDSQIRRSNIPLTGFVNAATPVGVSVSALRRSTTRQPSVVTGVGAIGVGGIYQSVNTLRRSKIVAPPVYEAVNHPPVIETITTPGKVYEIVTPIIDITPDTVIQQTKTTSTGGRLWARRDRATGCPWWCWLLLGLLLLLLLLAGLFFLYNHFFAGAAVQKEDQIVQPIVSEPLVEQESIKKQSQTIKQPVKQPEPEPVKEPQPQPIKEPETKQPEPTNEGQVSKNSKQQQNKTKQVQEPKRQPQPTKEPEPTKQPQPISQPAKDPAAQQTKESNNTTDTSKQNASSEDSKAAPPALPKTPKCPAGSFLHNGKCLRCPPNSTWDGFNCIRKVVTITKFVEYKTEGESSGDKEFDNQKSIQKLNNNSSSSNSSSSEASKQSSNSTPSETAQTNSTQTNTASATTTPTDTANNSTSTEEEKKKEQGAHHLHSLWA